jgi:hypothetical protein
MKTSLLQAAASGAWLPQFGELALVPGQIAAKTGVAVGSSQFHAEAHHNRELMALADDKANPNFRHSLPTGFSERSDARPPRHHVSAMVNLVFGDTFSHQHKMVGSLKIGVVNQ